MFRGGAADTPIPERWRSAHRQPATLEMLGPPAAFHLRPCPRPGAGTLCRRRYVDRSRLRTTPSMPSRSDAASSASRYSPEYGGTMPKPWPRSRLSRSCRRVNATAFVRGCRLAHAEATGETVEVAQSPSPDHELAVEDHRRARLGEAVELGNRSREARTAPTPNTHPAIAHRDDGAPAVKFRLNPPCLERTRRTPGDSKHRLIATADSLPKHAAGASSLLLAIALVAKAGLRRGLRLLAAIRAKAPPDNDLLRGEPAVLVTANVPGALTKTDLLSCGHGFPLSSPLRLRTHQPTTSRRRLVEAASACRPWRGLRSRCDADRHPQSERTVYPCLRDAGAVTVEQLMSQRGRTDGPRPRTRYSSRWPSDIRPSTDQPVLG